LFCRMDVMIDKTFNQQCMVADPKVDYGYGDAAPSTTDYGYGDAAPSTNASNDANNANNKHGDESTATTGTDYGYGSTDSNQYGYGDTSSGGGGGGEPPRRRERPRRRGSVTKYSLDATQEVQNKQSNTQSNQEGAAPGGEISFQPPPGTTYAEGKVPLDDGAPAAPSPAVGKIRKPRGKNNSATADDYGYGNAAPDSAQNPNGYGDAAPNSSAADKYGYGDASKYVYGDTSNDASKYGYGKTESTGLNDVGANKYGYADAGSDGGVSATSAGGEPRRRPRRRGSVTKYSLEATETVATATETVAAEHQPPPPPQQQEPPPLEEFMVTLKDAPDRQHSAPMSDDEMSCDESVDAMSCEGDEEVGGKKKKKKKKSRFGRFRIGRNRSGMSQGSKGSKGSLNGDD
jgi:hypothetical protein